MPRVGLIGTTERARVHRDRYEDVEAATLAGVAPADGESGTLPTDAPSYGGVADLLAADLDAVDVCSPPHTRPDAVRAAAEAGLPVLCGAPLAPTLSGAETVTDATADIPFLAGHAARFAPEFAAIRESVEDGVTGDPGVVRVERRFPRGRAGADWLADDAGTGSLLADLALQDFDALRWLVGDVDTAFTRQRVADGSEHALTLLRFENGAMAHVDTHRADLPEAPYHVAVEFAGEEGNLEFDSRDAAAMRFHDAAGSGPDPYTELPLTDGHGRDAYHRLVEHFLAVVDDGADPRVGAAESLATHRVAAAAAASVERGGPVSPAEVGR
jgi:predicted dehydrogenase